MPEHTVEGCDQPGQGEGPRRGPREGTTHGPAPNRTAAPGRPATQRQTTSVLTTAMLVYALGAGITAAAGTRLALQSILITVFGLHPLQVPPITEDRWDCCSSSLPHKCISMGQFACLLPALAVVAVSQAPSPESNPDSPSSVTAMVVPDTTIEADRSGVLCDQAMLCGGEATELCQHGCPRRDQSESTHSHCLASRRRSSIRLAAIHCLSLRARRPGGTRRA